MNRTYRILIVAVVAVGVVGGYWKLLLAPKRERAAALGKQLTEQEAKAAQAQATLGTYRKAKAAYATNYATLVGLGKAVPKDDDVRSLVVQVDASAKRSGVDFDNIDVNFSGAAPSSSSPAAAAAKTTPGAISAGSFSVMPFTLSFTGEYDGLANFFSRLERFVTVDGDRVAVSGRLLRIESLTLQPADTGWPGIQAQIGAASYIMPDGPEQASGGAAPATSGTGSSTSTSSSTTSSPSTTSAGDLR